ncbi:MAG: DUF3303 family protein [Imperialibacter sp.]|jgi:hypothetical protein|uniref:DUF3303 domain-containing protein n=1 Tax=Imperialibacter sp. TaxID=2038411 RepID=UPI0032EB5CF4
MNYMIVEKFRPGKVKELYKRFDEKGRLMPEGVTYINSWIDEKVEVCFQLMEAESMEKLQEWMDAWSDLCEFEVFPVISSADAKQKALSG